MKEDFVFSLKRTKFDENYVPADSTRLTTNFANLARGESRQQNLRKTMQMIDRRFNDLAHWDNPQGDRYAVELEIVSIEMAIGGDQSGKVFPLMEVLQTYIHDRHSQQRIEGIVGNSFSSYVRDYDFSVLLPQYHAGKESFSTPQGFGDLHGKLFERFVESEVYQNNFAKHPVICISVSTSKTYRQTGNYHPILGNEYQQSEFSATDQYFAKMGLNVRFFMPPGAVAPLAFYFKGDLLNDYSSLELISTISTMESFQRIYRPEIYNANSAAGKCYQPSLSYEDYSTTQIVYDRVERSQLAVKQGKYTEEHLIQPYRDKLEQWVFAVAA